MKLKISEFPQKVQNTIKDLILLCFEDFFKFYIKKQNSV